MACYGIRGESVFASRVERGPWKIDFHWGGGMGGGIHRKIKEAKILQPP